MSARDFSTHDVKVRFILADDEPMIHVDMRVRGITGGAFGFWLSPTEAMDLADILRANADAANTDR